MLSFIYSSLGLISVWTVDLSLHNSAADACLIDGIIAAMLQDTAISLLWHQLLHYPVTIGNSLCACGWLRGAIYIITFARVPGAGVV